MSDDETRQDKKLEGEQVEVYAQRTWRGKTNSYVRNETVILKILDNLEHEVQGIWEKDWRESVPGIDTRNADENTRMAGGMKYETTLDHGVRIHQDACPVTIQFAETEEYVDYDNSEYSSHRRRVYWVRYIRD